MTTPMTDATPNPNGGLPGKKQRPPRKKVELRGRLPAVVPGKAAKARVWTPAEAQAEAERLHETNRSFECNAVVELLYEFVTLTEEQIFNRVTEQVAITENFTHFTRTLRRYRKGGVVANLPLQVMQQVNEAGLTVRQPRLRTYTLGPVGERLVKLMRGDDRPLVIESDKTGKATESEKPSD